jgi:hypothetical protein
MKYARVGKNRIPVEVPTDYAEGLKMLTQAMNGYHDRRGGNLTRQSAAARVAFGLFGERFLAPEPTIALVYLLMELCRRNGAGLDALEKPRKWSAAEEEEKRT